KRSKVESKEEFEIDY
ncbi:hypothetical protein TNCT_630851, partial [Trichonephila clavata]